MPTPRTALGAAVAVLPLGALLYAGIASATEPAGAAAAASASHTVTDRSSLPDALPTGGTWKGAAVREQRAGAASRSASPHAFGSIAYNKWFAREYMAQKYGWGADQFAALEQLWQRESRWSQNAHNPSSGAHGIPQALPGSKMGSFGADWATNPETQIKWGLSYIKSVYGSPSGALASSHSRGWY